MYNIRTELAIMKHQKGPHATHEFGILALSDEHWLTLTENNILSTISGLRWRK